MSSFTKGAICALSVVGFGKIMYELGKRADKKAARCIEILIDTITKSEEEES